MPWINHTICKGIFRLKYFHPPYLYNTFQNKKAGIAQLPIRKLGSFIRLGELYCFAVIFGFRRVVFATRVLWRIKYHESQRLSYHCRLRQYHSDEVGISLLLSLPICVIMGLHRRAVACSRRHERSCFRQRRHQGTALQGVWALPDVPL